MVHLKRDNLFSQDATPSQMAQLAFLCLGVVVGFVLVPFGVVAIKRSAGHRAPFIMLLIANIFYLLFNIVFIPTLIFGFDTEVDPTTVSIFYGIDCAAVIMHLVSMLAALLAGLYLLQDRAASLRSNRPRMTGGYPMWLKICEHFAAVMVLVFEITAIGLATSADIQTFFLPLSTPLKQIDQIFDLFHDAYDCWFVMLAFYTLLGLDFVIGAVLLRWQMWKAGVRDTPAKLVLFALVPLFIMQITEMFFEFVWFGSQLGDFITAASQLDVDLVSFLSGTIVNGATLAVMTYIGCARSLHHLGGFRPMDDSLPLSPRDKTTFGDAVPPAPAREEEPAV